MSERGERRGGNEGLGGNEGEGGIISLISNSPYSNILPNQIID